ncbi:MAG: hypothetical protein EOP45_18205 [Sphingobacteriaceae bacterium]|nr:MAG: hypothetical protein EOP45_18205 [Sphingobacteriaceae bacterium]
MKICSKCKQNKDLTAFSVLKATSKHSSWCKSCHTDARLKAYHKDSSQQRQYQHKRRLEIKSYVDSQRVACVACGEDDPVCIDFHHTGDIKKEFDLGNSGTYSLERVKEELNKCITLCANCHRKHHAIQRGRLV